MDILEELKELIKKLNQEEIEYALCGGLAMAIYALPRATLDIDILIESTVNLFSFREPQMRRNSPSFSDNRRRSGR